MLTISQIVWCREVTEILDRGNPRPVTRIRSSEAAFVTEVKATETMDSHRLSVPEGLQEYEDLSYSRLNKLAALVRTDLPRLHRNIITALITIDVHARDVITDMVSDVVLLFYRPQNATFGQM